MCLRIKGIHRRYVGGKEGSEKRSEKERTGREERKAAAHSNAHSDDYARRCQTCSQTNRQMCRPSFFQSDQCFLFVKLIIPCILVIFQFCLIKI